MSAWREQAVAEATAWLGTPYDHNQRVRGAGVDCAQLLCAVYAACGRIAPVDPQYAHDHHLHSRDELYVEWLQRCGAVELQALAQPAPGDAAVFRFGRTWSHGAIVVGGAGRGLQLVHAYMGRGVIRTRIDEEPLAGRMPRWWSLEG